MRLKISLLFEFTRPFQNKFTFGFTGVYRMKNVHDNQLNLYKKISVNLFQNKFTTETSKLSGVFSPRVYFPGFTDGLQMVFRLMVVDKKMQPQITPAREKFRRA